MYYFSNKLLKACFLLSSTLYICGLGAQTRSFAGLPQVKPKNPVEYKDNLNASDEYDHIEKIYEKLVEAKGDLRMPAPSLNLRKEEAYVASMDYQAMDISIELKAYNVAKKYGDEAIAFLLAHELVHHYEKHGWRNQFADEIFDLETSKILSLVEDGVANEVQADVLGGFLAYSAGFGLFEKGDSLINDLYKAYGLTNLLKGYPSKQDRIELAKRNKVQIEKLTALFETATYLTIIGKYKEAYAYYGYLLNKYQSSEIYNNAGMTCLLSGVSKIDPVNLPFKFPLFFDLDFKSGSKDANTFAAARLQISEAITHFQTSILMNPAHIPAYLNKASAYLIQQIVTTDLGQKKNLLAHAKHILEVEIPDAITKYDLDESFENHILVLRSILAYYEKNQSEALTLLEVPTGAGDANAIYNLGILKKEPTQPKLSSTIKTNHLVMIDNTNAETYLKNKRLPKNLSNINKENVFRLVDTKQNHLIYLCENKGNDKDSAFDIAFFTNKQSYTGSVITGLKIGQLKDDFIKKIGQPLKTFNHLGGEIVLFEHNIILITDENALVTKIIDFQQNSKK